jgi:hypothetical protein
MSQTDSPRDCEVQSQEVEDSEVEVAGTRLVVYVDLLAKSEIFGHL